MLTDIVHVFGRESFIGQTEGLEVKPRRPIFKPV